MPPKKSYSDKKSHDSVRGPRLKAETGAIPGLPVLAFTDNVTENNFQTFRDALQLYAMKEYKDLGRMIELEEYYVPPEVVIPPPEELTPEADPGGFKAHDVRAQIAERRKAIASMESNRTALYSVILGQLSTESKARLRLSEHWPAIEANKDPLLLWLLVIETHNAGVEGLERRDYKNVRDAYASLRQGTAESLSDYHLHFFARHQTVRHAWKASSVCRYPSR